MSPFRESFQKELGRLLAYVLVSLGAWGLCALSGVITADKRPAITLLLFLASGLILWLIVILLLRFIFDRKTHKKVMELEKRMNAHPAERFEAEVKRLLIEGIPFDEQELKRCGIPKQKPPE